MDHDDGYFFEEGAITVSMCCSHREVTMESMGDGSYKFQSQTAVGNGK